MRLQTRSSSVYFLHKALRPLLSLSSFPWLKSIEVLLTSYLLLNFSNSVTRWLLQGKSLETAGDVSCLALWGVVMSRPGPVCPRAQQLQELREVCSPRAMPGALFLLLNLLLLCQGELTETAPACYFVPPYSWELRVPSTHELRNEVRTTSWSNWSTCGLLSARAIQTGPASSYPWAIIQREVSL